MQLCMVYAYYYGVSNRYFKHKLILGGALNHIYIYIFQYIIRLYFLEYFIGSIEWNGFTCSHLKGLRLFHYSFLISAG